MFEKYQKVFGGDSVYGYGYGYILGPSPVPPIYLCG